MLAGSPHQFRAMREMHYDEFNTHISEHTVLYLLLLPATDKRTAVSSSRRWPTLILKCHYQKHILDASQILFGSPPLYFSTSSAFYQQFSLDSNMPILLAFKDHDSSSPAAIYPMKSTANLLVLRPAIQEWVSRYQSICSTRCAYNCHFRW